MIRILRWADFQHYKGRRPPWVKVYVALLDDWAYRGLSPVARCLLVDLWLLASRTLDGCLHDASSALAWRLRMSDAAFVAALRELAGTVGEDGKPHWLTCDASNLLASCKQNACLETETEGETERERETDKEAEADLKSGGGFKGPSADYVLACVQAVNRGLFENPAIGAAMNPIIASSQVGAVSWPDDGIPLDLAVEVVADRARSYRPTPRHRQPNGLRYFDAAVRDAHERHATPSESDEDRRTRLVAEMSAPTDRRAKE